MAVSMEQLKELRDATGVSITACKKALEEANGDYEMAVDILRKKGEAKAADNAGRSTGEGAVGVYSEGGKIAMVKVACETDFVAKSDDFSALLVGIAKKVMSGEVNEGNKDDLAEIKDAVLKLGENLKVEDMAVLEGSSVGGYVHSNKKIGVIVALEGGNEELAKDVAMHAAATGPKVLSPEEVSEDLVAREKAIWTEQLANEGKPAEIIEKIMMGKEKKFREDNALTKQAFVKNPEQTIEQLLAGHGSAVKGFARFSV